MRLLLDKFMINALKQTIEPPYKPQDLYSIFVALFLMLLLPLTVYQITNLRANRSNASVFLNSKLNKNISVFISSLKDNQTVSGKIDVTIKANNETDSITSINLYSDNLLLATINNPSNANSLTTKVNWDTTKETNGKKTLFATATSNDGNYNNSTNINVFIINNDSNPPSVSFSNVNNGSYLSGNFSRIELSASDDFGISLVEVSLDNKIVSRFTKVPYEFNLDLSNLNPGNHYLQARAVDYLGNETSQTIEVYKGVSAIKE